jgi:hypothetical protein
MSDEQRERRVEFTFVVSEATLDALAEEVIRRVMLKLEPRNDEWQLLAHPEYPHEHPRRDGELIPDSELHQLRFEWFKSQGFSTRYCNLFLKHRFDPEWLRTCTQESVYGITGLGTKAWEEILRWRVKDLPRST